MTKEFILLILLYAGSGCATLIYGLVWFQLLESAIGSSMFSWSILVSIWLGSAAAGSLSAPRLTRRLHPLKLFALLQIAAGIIVLLGLLLIPFVGRIYEATGSRVVIAGIGFLPMALLTGAASPSIMSTAVRKVSFLYGAQPAGCAAGCLISAFYLLKYFDVTVAIYAAAGIYTAVAIASFALYWRAGDAEPHEANSGPADTSSRTVYVVMALSGLCMAGAVVIWSRLLSFLLGPSVYTSSIILAVFLLGLGIGGCIGSALPSSSAKPERQLGLCQISLCAAIAWGAYALAGSLPYWQIDPTLSEKASFHLDLARCVWAVMPASCLWGGAFHSALRIRGSPAGGVFAANIAGVIIGAAALNLAFINSLGAQRLQQTIIAISALAATIALFRRAWIAVAAALAIVFVLSVPALPADLVAYGRFLARNRATKNPITQEPYVPNIVYADEGVNSSVAVVELPSGYRTLHADGRIEDSNQPQDLRLHAMRAHISALYHSHPRSVLIVGSGTGITAGTFVLHPSVERIVICETEPSIIRAASRHFGSENQNVLQDRRVEIIYDDARPCILKTQEKFDVIASVPPAFWVKDAAALYTREYLQLTKEHLNPGGVISQRVPLHEVHTDIVKSEIGTFFAVFPEGTLWGNEISNGVGFDLTLLATNGPSAIDLSAIYKRLNSPDYRPVVASLQAAGFRSVAELFATYAGRAPDLASWLADAEINSDRNLRLRYLSTTGMNVFKNQAIYSELLAYRKFPDALFVGSDVVLQVLRDLIR